MLAGCGTAQPYGATERLVVHTVPAGASAIVKPDDLGCVTPCFFELSRGLPYVIEIRKTDHRPVSVHVRAGSDRPGKRRGLDPNPVRVFLERTAPEPPQAAEAPAPSPAPAAAPVVLPSNCIQPAMVDRATCADRLRLDATKQQVILLLGPPDGESRDGTTYRYGDRYLKFGAAGKLVGISDQPK